MLRFLPLLLVGLALAAPVFTAPLLAQDFAAQKQQLRATSLDSVAQLQLFAPSKLGAFVELRGVVKGTFSRGAGFALLLGLPEGKALVIDAPANLRSGDAGRIGNRVRVLCEITGITGAQIELALRAATLDTQPEETVSEPIAPVAALAPAPDEVFIGAEVQLPASTRPVSNEIPVVRGGNGGGSAQNRATQILKPFVVPTRPSRGRLPSRSAQTRPQSLLSNQNPYFGFSESHREAYSQLARANNPRLSRAESDEIAFALLSAAQTHNLDPRFLAAVVTVESRFNPRAVSGAGAMGLGQLMPFNLAPLGVQNPWVPMQNLHGAAKMLRQNLNTYGSRPDGTLLAVAAYHAGVGAVRRAGYRIPKVSTNKYAWKVYYAYKALAPELFR